MESATNQDHRGSLAHTGEAGVVPECISLAPAVRRVLLLTSADCGENTSPSLAWVDAGRAGSVGVLCPRVACASVCARVHPRGLTGGP